MIGLDISIKRGTAFDGFQKHHRKVVERMQAVLLAKLFVRSFVQCLLYEEGEWLHGFQIVLFLKQKLKKGHVSFVEKASFVSFFLTFKIDACVVYGAPPSWEAPRLSRRAIVYAPRSRAPRLSLLATVVSCTCKTWARN